MSIPTNKEISKVTYEGVEIPLPSGSGTDFLQWKCDNAKTLHLEFANMGNVDFDEFNEMLKKLDTSNVITIQSIFQNYMGSTLDVSSFRTSNVTNMSNVFNGCNSLLSIDLSNWDTTNVLSMEEMFANNYKLKTLDLSNFNTSNVRTMKNMFNSCKGLVNLDLSSFDTSSVSSINGMFTNCTDLTSLDLTGWNTSNNTDWQSVFRGCHSLQNILGTIDMIRGGYTGNMFYQCIRLTTVTLKNIKANLKIGSGTSDGHLLTLDTLINTIKELWDYSSGTTTYNLILSTPSKELLSNVYVKLITATEEQIAQDPNIIYKMPCEVCESTDEGAMLITDYATLKKWTIE